MSVLRRVKMSSPVNVDYLAIWDIVLPFGPWRVWLKCDYDYLHREWGFTIASRKSRLGSEYIKWWSCTIRCFRESWVRSTARDY